MSLHVVVDGSNLATEGRSLPSLKQLNEAVLAFMTEHPEAMITVVVDATFGHRIDSSEVAEFDEAVANNELVAPPAGAVGRGDAFVLSIANKVGATILTNDSYQEFHPQYPWLFDEGRLIGGKPVPHIGWVFVERSPVRGATSRKAMSDARRKQGRPGGKPIKAAKASPEASQPMPVPKSPPPGKPAAGKETNAADAKQPEAAPVVSTQSEAVAPASAAESHTQTTIKAPHVNPLGAFFDFVGQYPPGSTVTGVVDHYASHGAYVRIGEVMGYVALRAMADPAPRSAREVMKVGDEIELVVESFKPTLRSIDLAVPAMATAAAPAPKPARKAAAKKASAKPATTEPTPLDADEPAAKPARKRATKQAAATSAEPDAPASDAPADVASTPAGKQPRAKKAAAKAPAAEPAAPEPSVAERPPTQRAAAKRAPAKKAPATRTPAAPATASDPALERPPAAQAAATKAPAKKAPAKKAPAKKAATKKAPPANAATTKTPAKKAAAKAPADKAPTKKAAAKRAPAKRAAAEQVSP